MAAYYFPRKLFEDSEVNCTAQCNPVTNPTGYCAPICSVYCPPPVCNYTVLSLPPLPPPPPTGSSVYSTPLKHHHSSLSIPLKISLVILVITFSLFLLYTLYKFYTVWYRSRRRRSQPPSPENQETTHDEFLDHDVLDHPIWYIRTIGLQPSVISAITVVKYNKSDGLIDDTYCSVCLSEFEEDETLRLLPKCNHAFHVSCIDTWLRSHTNCPLCRAGIVKNTTNPSSADQNVDDSGQTEESQLAISIPEEPDREETQEDCESSELRETVGGSGTRDFLIMRRSVSLNDFAACRIRSDVRNNYYSDRHEVQIQALDGDLGFELIKVEQTSNNSSREVDLN